MNRVWQYHFGRGIVATPDNFGELGARPTHPELLDYLARELVANGWSLKEMHREIMKSATYRQSAGSLAAREADPENKLFARWKPRRLLPKPAPARGHSRNRAAQAPASLQDAF